jgi:hypothetical protein
LDWCAPQEFEWTRKGVPDTVGRATDVDVVIGSDIVYDPSLIPLLLGTVAFFVTSRESPASLPCEAYLACTIRTEATFEEFRSSADRFGLVFEVVSLRTYGDLDDVTAAPSCTNLLYTMIDDVGLRAAAKGKQDVAVVKLRKK